MRANRDQSGRLVCQASTNQGCARQALVVGETRTEAAWYWKLAEEFRDRLPRTAWPLELLREAKARGLIHSWRDVSALAELDERAAELLDPPVVVDFVVALLSDGGQRKVIDPWAGLGITLWALDEAGVIKSGVGIEVNQETHRLARELNPSDRMTWINANAAVALPTLQDDSDVVVGSPPMGLPATTLLTGATEIRASATLTMLVQASHHIGHDGTMAVILPESFFSEQAQPIRDALAKGRVWPTASFALPARAFRTTIPTSVVVFERRESESLFVAELDPSVDVAALVSNFRNWRTSKVPQLGRLVPRGQFRAWRGYVNSLEIERLAAESGLRPIALRDICSAVRRARSDGTFPDSASSVYLPNVGMSNATTSTDELSVKPQCEGSDTGPDRLTIKTSLVACNSRLFGHNPLRCPNHVPGRAGGKNRDQTVQIDLDVVAHKLIQGRDCLIRVRLQPLFQHIL